MLTCLCHICCCGTRIAESEFPILLFVTDFKMQGGYFFLPTRERERHVEYIADLSSVNLIS